MKQVLRRELGSDKPWERPKTGYEAQDLSTGKLQTLEKNMEKLLLAQPETLLAGLTGGLPVVVIKDYRLLPASLTDRSLIENRGGLIRSDHDRRTGLVGKSHSDDAGFLASRCCSAKDIVDLGLEMTEGVRLDVFVLLRRVEELRLFRATADCAPGRLIGHLVAPVLPEHLEIARALRRRTHPIEITLVIERHLDADRARILELLQFARQVVEHPISLTLARRISSPGIRILGVGDPLNEAWGWSLEPCGFETISKFAKTYPLLAQIMKERNPSGNYIRIDLLICTRPPHKSLHQVFGLFLLDKAALAARDPHPIEEDFLVIAADTKHPTYYSGMGRRARRSRANPHRDDLNAFARAYGGGGRYYGCIRHGKQWRLLGHYRAIKDPMFDSDPRFRAAVDHAVERARIEIELKAMGAM